MSKLVITSTALAPVLAGASDTPCIFGGEDTHKHAQVAVTLSALGARVGTCQIAARAEGNAGLLAWAPGLGEVAAFAVDGTCSYGTGLASYLRRHAARVVEVGEVDRRKRRRDGKDDTRDAEAAARGVLSGSATAVLKSADGLANMTRQIKIARDIAAEAHSDVVTALTTLLVNAPDALRQELEPITDAPLLKH